MPVTLLVGALFGDEGKGRVARELARDHDVVVRANGGPNASHTILEGDRKWVLRQTPAGVLGGTPAVLADGMLVDLVDLHDELAAITETGVDTTRVWLSHRAHVVLPSHKLRERRTEEERAERSLGTTRQGIGLAMADKVARTGVRVEDLLDPARRRDVLAREREFVDEERARRPNADPPIPTGRSTTTTLSRAIDALAPRVRDTGALLRASLDQGAHVLVEGAQATLLDLDHGCWPHVTASSPIAAGLLVGAGLPPSSVTRVVGVTRAYVTRQAKGFLATEVHVDDEDAFRARVHDYALRIGYLDLPALRYATRVNGFTELVVTKLDVLADRAPVRVCTAYDVDGTIVDELPMTREAQTRARPLYEDLPGFPSVDDVRAIADLPKGARAFLDRVARASGAPIRAVSTARSGPLVVDAPARAPRRAPKPAPKRKTKKATAKSR